MFKKTIELGRVLHSGDAIKTVLVHDGLSAPNCIDLDLLEGYVDWIMIALTCYFVNIVSSAPSPEVFCYSIYSAYSGISPAACHNQDMNSFHIIIYPL